ncbi:MAG: 2-oxoacid:ferredoxin oxidoreductase subunit beta [Planctomycetes bacterium]|nr:2-oxoacid:ferredoxin oxidoreductase subunit beta [Planctomycetota bacterium]
MATTTTIMPGGRPALTPKDFNSGLKPIWCPGCGDFGVLQGLYRALTAIGREPHEIAFISGIGCSSRIPGYTTVYGFNSVHGRALPIAQGVKLANPDLLVIVAGGDGDGFSIGGGHVAHAVRRNADITYIVMDNQVYGLTKGQLSPTSPKGLRTITSPLGSLEDPVNPLLYVLAYGAGFVAQSTPADMPGMTSILEEAIRYPGFAFVNIQSPCVTFGQEDQQLRAHKTRMKTLASLGHDPSSMSQALERARDYGTELYTGVFYRNPEPPLSHDRLIRLRQEELAKQARPRSQILDAYLQRGGAQ